MPSPTTLTDNFDDNSKDGTKWASSGNLVSIGWDNSSTTVSETGQTLQIAISAAGHGDGYISSSTYTFADGDRIFIKASTTDASGGFAFLAFGTSGAARIAATINNGQVFLEYRNPGNSGFAKSSSAPTYSSTSHAWLGLRYNASDDSFKLDTATSSASNPPVSGDWTNDVATMTRSTAGSISLTGNVSPCAAGFGSVTVTFDGLNTATAAASGISATASGTIPLTGSATAAAEIQGTATGSFPLTGSAAAQVKVQSTATGSLPLTGASSGTVKVQATASTTFSITGTASVSIIIRGTATGTLPLSGSASNEGLWRTVSPSVVGWSNASDPSGVWAQQNVSSGNWS